MSYNLFTKIDHLLTLQQIAEKQGRNAKEADLSILRKAAILTYRGEIIWVGEEKKLPKQFAQKSIKEIKLSINTVLPGFIESHTHLVHAGNRSAEFEKRNQGVSYQEISRQGGGILSTMKATRLASKAVLLETATQRVKKFVSQGVTTLEIKSGYALNSKDEVKMLEVVASLRSQKKMPQLVSSFLGAHALPPEFKSYVDYLKYLSEEVLPIVAKKALAERVDIFIENGFFQKEEAQEYLANAKKWGFDLVIHADQLSLSGGAEVAIKLGARSADHLVQIGESEIAELAKSEVTSVLLPAADLYMKMKYPPARLLIDAGARVALATDFNPGSSPTQDINLVGLLARIEMKMTLPEVLSAYTVGAAYAVNRQDSLGSLEVGKSADFSCTDKDWTELFYSIGDNSISSVYRRSSCIYIKK